MLCYRRIHPWCATSHYDEAHPIVCSFCASSSSGRAHFQVHNVQMRKHFVISGCATDTAPVVAEEPALTVHSSEKDMMAGAEHPLEKAPLAAQPSSVPLVDRMVCVQAHRSSQTAPFIVPDIHRVLEGTGVLECPDHKLDHGVPDPKCDYCKRALGPLYRHSRSHGKFLSSPLTSRDRTPQWCIQPSSYWLLFGACGRCD